jgi:outer membrane protein assembly factor BamB
MTADDLIFVGTSGYVRAVDRKTGADAWTANLPSTSTHIVTLLFADGVLYAGASGQLFALDPLTGAIRWHNGLAGLGYKHMTLAIGRASSMTLPQLVVLEDEERDANTPTVD